MKQFHGMDVPETPHEIVNMLASTSPMERARRVFSSAAARIEQAERQRVKPSIYDLRQMEYEAVVLILRAYHAENG